MHYELNKSEAITKQDSREPLRAASHGGLRAGRVARDVRHELQGIRRTGRLRPVGIPHGRAEQPQRAHPRVQPHGVLHVPRARYDGRPRDGQPPRAGRTAMLHSRIPAALLLISGQTRARPDVLRLHVHRHSKHNISPVAILRAGIMGAYRHQPDGLQRTQLLGFGHRADRALLVRLRILRHDWRLRHHRPTT